jgi:hypothetical protein
MHQYHSGAGATTRGLRRAARRLRQTCPPAQHCTRLAET